MPTMNSVSGGARQYAEGDGVEGRDAGVCDALLLVPVGLDGGKVMALPRTSRTLAWGCDSVFGVPTRDDGESRIYEVAVGGFGVQLPKEARAVPRVDDPAIGEAGLRADGHVHGRRGRGAVPLDRQEDFGRCSRILHVCEVIGCSHCCPRRVDVPFRTRATA